MNGSGKQSFYEIQLNNGSLIAAFLVAVALGVAVFMLGVMVGRGQAPEPLMAEGGMVEDLGAAGDDEATTPADPEFFEKVQESDEPPTSTTGEQPPTTAPVAEASAPEQEPEEASGLPEADPSLASGYVIQVKSTPDRDDADALQGALAQAGYPAFVIAGDVRGSTTFRVRVGRYRTAEDASEVERVLRQRNDVQDTWITTG